MRKTRQITRVTTEQYLCCDVCEVAEPDPNGFNTPPKDWTKIVAEWHEVEHSQMGECTLYFICPACWPAAKTRLLNK